MRQKGMLSLLILRKVYFYLVKLEKTKKIY